MSDYLALSQLSKEYLFSMVQSMYHYEARQTATLENIDELLSDAEITEFYQLYMGI
jgi:hypothetical protein